MLENVCLLAVIDSFRVFINELIIAKRKKNVVKWCEKRRIFRLS